MMNLNALFPRGSKSFFSANALPSPSHHPSNHGKVKIGKRGRMNKTEAEFAMILEAMKRNGEILRYEFEGVTLRFAGVRYTPDFVVIADTVKTPIGNELRCVKFIEVKGPFIKGNRERAVERFRHAKTFWPEFTFECHQRTKDGWRQII